MAEQEVLMMETSNINVIFLLGNLCVET